jgi:Tfp pilus assembly protein PilX
MARTVNTQHPRQVAQLFARVRSAHAGSRHSGQVLIIFALSLMVIIGMLGLSIDSGYLMAQRRNAQSAADASALAADKAVQLSQLDKVQATGQGYASSNGFANGGSNSVSVNRPPTSGSRAGDSKCVETVITHNVSKFFICAVYSGTWQVTARGVACNEPTSRPYAILALDPGGSGITSGGSSYLTINDGGAMSDNNVDICGTASWLQADGPLDAVNGITVCSNADVDAQSQNGSSPPAADPLASVPGPTSAECGATQPNPNIQNSDPATITLQPGNYTNGISISGSNKTITFAPGVYCLGKDLSASSGSNGTVLKGTNVIFAFSGSAMFDLDGGGVDAQFTSGPGSACAIAACNAHILIYYGPNNCSDLWLVGGNGMHVDGIVYAPCSTVHLGGGSGSEITGQVLGGSVAMKGGSNLTVNYKGYVDTKIPLVYLVE